MLLITGEGVSTEDTAKQPSSPDTGSTAPSEGCNSAPGASEDGSIDSNDGLTAAAESDSTVADSDNTQAAEHAATIVSAAAETQGSEVDMSSEQEHVPRSRSSPADSPAQAVASPPAVQVVLTLTSAHSTAASVQVALEVVHAPEAEAGNSSPAVATSQETAVPESVSMQGSASLTVVQASEAEAGDSSPAVAASDEIAVPNMAAVQGSASLEVSQASKAEAVDSDPAVATSQESGVSNLAAVTASSGVAVPDSTAMQGPHPVTSHEGPLAEPSVSTAAASSPALHANGIAADIAVDVAEESEFATVANPSDGTAEGAQATHIGSLPAAELMPLDTAQPFASALDLESAPPATESPVAIKVAPQAVSDTATPVAADTFNPSPDSTSVSSTGNAAEEWSSQPDVEKPTAAAVAMPPSPVLAIGAPGSALADSANGSPQSASLSQSLPDAAAIDSFVVEAEHEQDLVDFATASEHSASGEPGNAEGCGCVEDECMASGGTILQRAVGLIPSWRAVLLLTVGGASVMYAANRWSGVRATVNESNMFPT